MKFDFVIGNPPYQDNTIGDNGTFAPPVYDKFLDASFEISDKVELIHPARFLFNAGSTPKAWNKKMLTDEHYKVMEYHANSAEVFANTDIKGGVVISYRDKEKTYGSIKIFTPYPQLNSILPKVIDNGSFVSLSDSIVSSYAYHFTDVVYEEHPEAKGLLSKGHDYDFKSNVFEKMPQPFEMVEPTDGEEYLRILGRMNNERAYRYIKRKYVNQVTNLDYYKVFMSGATGTGEYGETISPPIIGMPKDGSTETFLSIGTLGSLIESENVIKYIKTKFARAMFGILKSTQANTPEKWKYVPLQDFTSTSDIDWSKSVPEIDKQLYAKYGLTQEEIDFIEANVKEMV